MRAQITQPFGKRSVRGYYPSLAIHPTKILRGSEVATVSYQPFTKFLDEAMHETQLKEQEYRMEAYNAARLPADS